MSRKPFVIRDAAPGAVEPCPKCGNLTKFTAHAQQVAEDCCEVWIVCQCGHDPHDRDDRLEDIWGSLDRDTIINAIGCWNDAVKKSSIKSKIPT